MPRLAQDEERVIRRLLERVRTEHWIQGAYARRVGNKRCYCLVGHVNVLTGNDPEKGSKRGPLRRHHLPPTDLRDRVLEALRGATCRSFDLESWNDAPETTRERVEIMLSRALGDR